MYARQDRPSRTRRRAYSGSDSSCPAAPVAQPAGSMLAKTRKMGTTRITACCALFSAGLAASTHVVDGASAIPAEYRQLPTTNSSRSRSSLSRVCEPKFAAADENRSHGDQLIPKRREDRSPRRTNGRGPPGRRQMTRVNGRISPSALTRGRASFRPPRSLLRLLVYWSCWSLQQPVCLRAIFGSLRSAVSWSLLHAPCSLLPALSSSLNAPCSLPA